MVAYTFFFTVKSLKVFVFYFDYLELDKISCVSKTMGHLFGILGGGAEVISCYGGSRVIWLRIVQTLLVSMELGMKVQQLVSIDVKEYSCIQSMKVKP